VFVFQSRKCVRLVLLETPVMALNHHTSEDGSNASVADTSKAKPPQLPNKKRVLSAPEIFVSHTMQGAAHSKKR
jgi:hypothetical protein